MRGYLSGQIAMVTMESWMFLPTYRAFRERLLDQCHIRSMVHMPYLGKGGTSMGISFGTTSFVCQASRNKTYKGAFSCTRYYETDDAGVPLEFPTRNERLASASSEDLAQIPGTPVAYWASPTLREQFSKDLLSQLGTCKNGMTTGDNDRFMRAWHEVSLRSMKTDATNQSDSKSSGCTWFPYSKGGEFRRWYGNNDFVLNWKNNGAALKSNKPKSILRNPNFYFHDALTWSLTSSAHFGARDRGAGALFDVNGMSGFFDNNKHGVLALLNSSVSTQILKIINPTMAFQSGDIERIPVAEAAKTEGVKALTRQAVLITRSDWDAFETSWEFTALPLLSPDHRAGTLEATYIALRAHWQSMTDEMQRLEEENNRIFIDAYGLQDELTPEVPIEEITLTCNPAYRYGVKGKEGERETRLRADTMAEFLSYAVGCMFGRYSLDAPGLILANQGETLADYLSRVSEPSFLPDEDNVIPVLDADWFADDIVDRFRKFLRVTFGEAHFRENLAFIEAQIGDIRKYFKRGFYDDHVKRYKKRPIYWMFSSPKGTFQALIYMHRYRPDTVSVLLNDYLREFIRKLEAERARLEKLSDDPAATQTQRTKALKEVGVIAKQLAELEEWEREVIFPLAQAKIEIDLDDGVKRNYPLFGAALKPIKGLEAADE
ncbi:BREX-1 system adenine-specific DNA-methyltransferase PglX [Aquibium sp. ELW1220]|uniref:BREX-1 system adenine-specific DNA-methyltransferase PglX n=1 Tax=Aquibium sp. ELW1220 TaxID=2976766 RepID=UPI0025B1A132|nr:BREX-1 system adenine-specific DNA-methyltransferase PglX [Aquibium sp. ELW1220]MDN2582998.1 BREX-1 system adenine-specific DNA-methyltransferase PglX [Aquibium sp. ELW1220]